MRTRTSGGDASPGANRLPLHPAGRLFQQLRKPLAERRTRKHNIAPGFTRGRREVSLHVGEESEDLYGADLGIGFDGTQSLQGRTRPVVQIEDQGTDRNLCSPLRNILRSDRLNPDTHQLCGLLDLGQKEQIVDYRQNCFSQSLPLPA